MLIYLYLPKEDVHVEVALAQADHKPTLSGARQVWRDRQAGRPTGVVLVVVYPEGSGSRAVLVGPFDESSTADHELPLVDRVIARALDEQTTTRALAALAPLFDDDVSGIPGLRNGGLFALHALVENTRRRSDWAQAGAVAAGARGRRGEDLLRALGWEVVHRGRHAMLRAGERGRAVAVLLEGDEVFDRPSLLRGHDVSPVEQGLLIAREQEVAWVLAVQGSRVRLYSADPERTVARGGAAHYLELDVDLLDDGDLGFVGLLLTPGALHPDGTIESILQDSREHATALGVRLRERIYRDVVPDLAEIVAAKQGYQTEHELERAYHQTLVILFRLLFVAYAEDGDVLPYRTNTVYRSQSLKKRAIEFAEGQRGTRPEDFDDRATDLWSSLQEIWRGIYHGHEEWGIPPYGGSLFRDDTPDGAAIAELRLTNREIGPALHALLVDATPDGGRGPVDFQVLSVREFGTIYEGLLESSLSFASVDLTIEPRSEAFVPAGPDDDVVVRAGEVYFHDSSGARKATGSYFTKEFAVDHLLTTALEPTLAEHLGRVGALLEDGKEADAAEEFFAFRVADIAMGSGHFLVAAVDRMASIMGDFLAQRAIPGVAAELDVLHSAAVEQLRRTTSAEESPDPQLDRTALLRRQIAKRCIYGVDVNEIAVDLARLALWIHTFVPGLPMSDLGRGLVHGNSLTGIGTIDEALDLLEPEARGSGAQSLFYEEMSDGLAAGAEPARRAALLFEVTVTETREAEALRTEAEQHMTESRLVLDAAIAGRLGEVDLRLLAAQGWEALVAAGGRQNVREVIKELAPVHFPVAFPEVFRPGLANPGFDVVLGNPPWEKIKVEEHGWWGLRFPGLRSMSQRDKNAALKRYREQRPDLVAEYDDDVAAAEALRAVLRAGPYPLGSGDTDLYKAFAWREWDLVREGGRVGVVFPRGALSGSGTAAWREDILVRGAFDDVCFLGNNRQWVFDDVDVRYTVALTTLRRGGSREVAMSGPFYSLSEFLAGKGEVLRVGADEFVTWAAGASFPLLPSNESAGVFRKMRAHPRFDSTTGLRLRPLRELDASGDRALFDFDLSDIEGRTPVLAGASFNLWDPDFGGPYASADPEELEEHLHRKRQRQARTSSSAFYGTDASDPATLPMHRARVAFRDVARATDSRTVIAALIPPGSALTHKAPYLVRHTEEVSDEAYLVGVMSSIPFDWYSRRFVELNLTFEVLGAFPVPLTTRAEPLRRRVVEAAGRLAAIDDRFADWAAEVGVPVGSANEPDVKNDLIAELDAVVGHLYGLSRDDMVHIFETFHRGWDYHARLEAVLAHFDRWAD